MSSMEGVITDRRIGIWISNGIDSGFPTCCINFFCTVESSDRGEDYNIYAKGHILQDLFLVLIVDKRY